MHRERVNGESINLILSSNFSISILSILPQTLVKDKVPNNTMEAPTEGKPNSDNDESSEEESLAAIQKRQSDSKLADKHENSEEMSEDEDFMPGIYVEVKLNEGNASQEPVDHVCASFHKFTPFF